MSDLAGRVGDQSDKRLRHRSGIKWSRIEPGELPADIAELDFAVAAPIRQVLRRMVRRSDFGYPDFVHGTPVVLRELFAERMSHLYGWRIDPARVELSAQVTQALCGVILTATQPGDAVVTHAPTYPPFLAAIRGLGRQVVTLPVVSAPEQWAAALAPVRARLRLFVLCQPHNPTGQVLDAAALAAVAGVAEAHDAVVFSDEIYQDLVLPPRRHTPAGLTAGLSERTITFTSAAKSHGIPGLRCAVGHFGSTELHQAYQQLPWHLRDGASILGIAATLAAWQHCDGWLEGLRRTLLGNRALLVDEVARWPGVQWTPPAAGFLAWWDFARTSVGADPSATIRRHARVVLQPGATFGSAYGSHARLNFGTSPERLMRILGRIGRVLDAGG